MSVYTEDQLLLLSGLQHLAFCERQWALIHIEQTWSENRLTASGRVLHDRVHGQTEELRNDLLVARGLPLRSFRLGISAIADVVEFVRVSADQQVADSLQLEARSGWWRPRPVEYKRGRPKREAWDRVQLCAQALCLEEMLALAIAEGVLFYGATRRRTEVRFDRDLRDRTEALAARMHRLFSQRVTPAAVLIPGCKSCSLRGRCLPELLSQRRPVASYHRTCLRRETA